MDYLSPLGWVPTGRQNRHFPVPTDRGYSPSVISSWWKNGQLLLSPQQVVLENHIAKENPFPDAKDEGVFDSGCSKSMTGNKERLNDFQTLKVFNSPMLHFLRVGMVINSPWIMPILGTKELASPEQTAPDAAFSRDIPLICVDFSSILVKTQSSRYVVSTGRVVVPTTRYVVPAGNVIIVSSGRLSLISTGRVLSPGKEEKCGAQDAAEKIKAVTLSAAKGLSRSKAEHATAAALI
nr:hypothetical protein [Tanacetum cinerariifolium]